MGYRPPTTPGPVSAAPAMANHHFMAMGTGTDGAGGLPGRYGGAVAS